MPIRTVQLDVLSTALEDWGRVVPSDDAPLDGGWGRPAVNALNADEEKVLSGSVHDELENDSPTAVDGSE